MSFRTLVKTILMIALLATCGASLFISRYQPVPQIVFNRSPPLTAAMPIGEITQDFRADQHVSITISENKLKGIKHEPICVEVLLANYSDRPNTGQFAVDLVIDNAVFSQLITAADVHDNVYHRICFEGASVDVLTEARSLHLVLRGISSPPGAAVTAWTTPNLSVGQLVNVADSFTSRSLVFRFTTQSVSDLNLRHAVVLIILGALAVGTMLLTSRATIRPESDLERTQDTR